MFVKHVCPPMTAIRKTLGLNEKALKYKLKQKQVSNMILNFDRAK